MNQNITAGIDLGNQSSILSIPTDHGIDIILNESSNRKTPTMVIYQEGRRAAGEFAQQQQMMNISNTITQIKQLIGLPYDSKERQSLSNSVPYKIVRLENGLSGIELENGQIMKIEQILGYYLKSLFELLKKKNPKIKQIVLTIPPTMTEIQRRILLNAASISKVKIAYLLESSLASAIAYVKIHGNRFEKPSNVLFVEFGDTSMNVCIGKLSKDSVEIKYNFCDNSLGGQHFNELLEKYLIQKVNEKYKIDPTKNKRSLIRFKQAVEKVKKTLSSNPVVLFEIPSLMNDIDISMQVKREEFIDLIKDDLSKIGPNIEKAIQNSGIKKDDISYVEIIGGSSRIPSIKEQIKEIIGNEAKMSLDLDECFAIGAGFIASKIDGKNIGIKIINDKKCPYEITIKSEQKSDLIKILDKSTTIPASKKISLSISEKEKMTIYSNQIPIGHLLIETGIKEKVDIEIEIKIDSFGLIDVKCGKCKSFSYSKLMTLNSEEILTYKKIEEEQSLKDQIEIEIDNTKNDLESLIFSTENELKSAKIQDKKSIENQLKLIHNWFDENEFERLNLNIYKSKINEINRIRNEISSSLKNESKKMNQIQQIKQKLENLLNQVKNDTNESILLQSEIKNKIKLIDDLLKSSNNSFNINDFTKEIDEIEMKLNSLNEIEVDKKKKIKKRRSRKVRNQPQQIFRNRLSDTWSPFGMRNNLFSNLIGNNWIYDQNSENEYDYSYEYENENQIYKNNNNNSIKKEAQAVANENSFADQIKKKAQEKQKRVQIEKEEQLRKQNIEKQRKADFEKEEQLRKQKEIEIEKQRKAQIEKEEQLRKQNIEKQRKADFEKEEQLRKQKEAEIEMEKRRRAQIEYEEQLRNQRKSQMIEKENQRRAQIEQEKKLRRQKEAELEMQRRVQFEQEKQRREKEAEMYQRERLMNNQWGQNRFSQTSFNPWGANPQRQSVRPKQYQQYQPQQRRVIPGYGYPWGF